jgi:hypothetical protein
MDDDWTPLTRKPSRHRQKIFLDENRVYDVEGFDAAEFIQKVLRAPKKAKAASKPAAMAGGSVEVAPPSISLFPLPENIQFVAAVGERLKPTWAEYLNAVSPHRGLLLYGGDLCAATFALLQGLVAHPKQSIVLLVSGHSTVPYADALLQCSREFAARQRWGFESGEWRVLAGGQANFLKLSPKEQEEIEGQLRRRREAFTVVPYHGLNAQNIRSRFRKENNPFDRAVVVIEDAHTFARCIWQETSNANSHWSVLYEWLLAADACKVVGLASAPAFDHLTELGVLYNLLYGYVRVWTVETTATLETLPKSLKPWVHRFVVRGNKATVFRAPRGFKIGDKDLFVRAEDDDKDDAWFKRTLGEVGKVTADENLKLLPDAGKWTLSDDEVVRRIAGLTAYVATASLNPLQHMKQHTVQTSEYQETIYNMMVQDEAKNASIAHAVLNFAYPQTVHRPEKDGNRLSDAMAQLRSSNAFRQLKKFSPKLDAVLKSLQHIRSRTQGRQLVVVPDAEHMALFKECLLAHGYAEYSTKETSQSTSPSQLFMSGDAALFNAPECPTRLDVFLAEVGETLHLNNVTQVHIVQPNRNLAEMERVLHFSSAKHIEAHVYVVTQTRDGATVDETAMEEVLRKRAMLDRWVNMVQKTSLKCKSLTGKCVAPP